MEKLKYKITLEVLNEDTAEFPETKEFVEECLEQVSLRKDISGRGNLYFYKPRSKELAQKKTFIL